ncbi:hypothetical protein AB0D59_01105 [Streptomyces sp. NPDC048417]|uniref:hypothetical protein n=1 Tax=Streptomyces sp. NPDC048417 TaxID=3155387 RepID=UPI00342F8D3C
MTSPATRPVPKPGPRPGPVPAARPPVLSAPTTAPSPSAAPTAASPLIAPGKLRRDEVLRAMYQRGIRLSRMLPETRLVALTLLPYANYKSGLIKHVPTPEQLAYGTGLARGQVLVHIEILTQRGWLTQQVLHSGPTAGQEVIQLRIPALALEQIRQKRDHAD